MGKSSLQIIKPERETQNRVIALFRDALNFRYLGNRSDTMQKVLSSRSRMERVVEDTHNARFQALMDQHLPKWRSHRETLNRLPVLHESWGY